MLDVSCGTGSLALLAKEQVGPEGGVHGVDASEQMIAYARRKAKRSGVDIAFDVAAAQQLPFGDASFDVVLSTLALHHLPRPARAQLYREARRVLKPDGRALVVDFAEGKKRPSGLLRRLKHRHGSVPPEEITAAMCSAGFEIAGTGPIGTKSLHFVLARQPGSLKGEVSSESDRTVETTHVRSNSLVAVTAGLLVAGLLLLHGAAGARIVRSMKDLGGTGWTSIGVAAIAAIAIKVALLRRLHKRR
jgi:SAM-dependent methyltransferase